MEVTKDEKAPKKPEPAAPEKKKEEKKAEKGPEQLPEWEEALK